MALQYPKQRTGGLQKAKEHSITAAKCDGDHVRCKNKPARPVLAMDFSSAFDTTDHDKLLVLCIKHSFGFPKHAVQVIAGLFTNAITKIMSPLSIK